MGVSEYSSDLASDAGTIPPPPYRQGENPPRDTSGLFPPEKENAVSSPYPPQPHHTQAAARVLHVWYDGWHISRVRVLDTDNATPLYTIRMKITKPHLVIESASAGSTIGTVSFHTLSNRIDATVHDSSTTLTCRGLFKNGHTYPSPALGGATLTWKTQGHSLDLVCLDEGGVAIARFCFSNWSLRKAGRVELMGPQAASGALMEEIIVTGTAMVEYSVALRSAAT